jgi:hypothetical protein
MRHELALLSLSESKASKGGHIHVAIEQASGPEQQFTGEGTMTTAYDQYELYGLGRARGRGRSSIGSVGGTGGTIFMGLIIGVAAIAVVAALMSPEGKEKAYKAKKKAGAAWEAGKEKWARKKVERAEKRARLLRERRSGEPLSKEEQDRLRLYAVAQKAREWK